MDANLSYREAAVRGASPVGLVVLLYEQLVEDLRRAERAMENNQVEGRTSSINHALLIVGHLQNQLNLQAGGQVARNLERFYNLLRNKLLEAQVWISKEIPKEQISLLLDLRDAWTVVEREQGARSTSLTSSSQTEKPDAGSSGGGWSA
jgi:flagellar protein FliS